MKTYQSDQIKNIAILGNSGSGKTTLAEAMIFNGGVIDRRGTVDGKNTVSDYRPIEHENGNSIFSTVLYTEFNNAKINILDTPGLDDFCGGVISSLYAADCALLLVNAQNGVEVGTEIQFRHTANMNKPVIIGINDLDHEKSNFDKSVEMLRERLGSNVTLIQFPVNEGLGFNSVIDVIKMKMLRYGKDGGKYELVDIPAEYAEKASELQTQLIEKAAESDESLMELFFANDTLTEDEIRKGLKEGITKRGLFPVLCLSAKSNVGVDRIMEFIVNVAPMAKNLPGFINNKNTEIKSDPAGPASTFVFKTSVEEHIGEINYFKVISGKITESMDVVNTSNGTKERLSQIYICAGKNRTKVSEMNAGDIGAFVKLKNTKTNHTLNAPGQDWSFPGMKFPNPKYRAAIKPLSEGDDEKLGEALNRMHLEDPTILIEYSKELKQIIISGQGEYHLNILKWHLDNIFKIETNYLAPKIPYRETITKVAQADYRHKKQSGGSGQFGEVHMVIERYEEGSAPKPMMTINGKEIKMANRDREEIVIALGW